MKNLLSSVSVSRLLGISTKQVDKLTKKGKIPHITLPDGSIRFDEQAIEDLIHPENSRFLNLKTLAVKLGLPEKYLSKLAQVGAIPFFNVNSEIMFDLLGVVDSLARLNPQDQNIDKVLSLYEKLKGLKSVAGKLSKPENRQS